MQKQQKRLSHGARVEVGILVLLLGAWLSTPALGQTYEIKVWKDAQHQQPISAGDHISLPYSEAGAAFKSSLHVWIVVTNSAKDDPNEWVTFSVDEGRGAWELGGNPHEYSGPGLENWFSAPFAPAPPTQESARVRISYPAHNLDFSFTVAFTGGGTPSPPPSTGNRPPSVTLDYAPAHPTPNDTLRFHADASDPDGDPLTYRWFINGNEQSQAKTNSVRWDNPAVGHYTVTVRVYDDKGATDEATVMFTVGDQQNQPPIVTLTVTSKTTSRVELHAEASDPDGDELSYTWYVDGTQNEVVTSDVVWENPPVGKHTITVVVSDNKGGTEEDTVTITVVAPPPSSPPPSPGSGPCEIEFMTLNPGTEIAGPLLTPGTYLVWTSVAGPNRTFNDWLSTGPYEFEAGHEYTIVMDSNSAVDGAVTVFKTNNGMTAEATAYYRNEGFANEFAITVCAAPPPPPPPPSGSGPCEIEFMTLNPGTEIAGPLLTPGAYMVWTSVAGPNRTFNDWLRVGPYDFRAGHEYLIVIAQDTARNGVVSVHEGVNEIAEATATYVNAQSDYEFAITVCPLVASTLPPTGGGVEAALDANANGVLDDTEVRQAIQYWILGQTVPGTDQTIDDAKIRSLIQMWILGTPVSASAARAQTTARPVALSLKAPNPLTRQISFNAPGVYALSVRVFDLAGRLIVQKRAAGPRLRFELRTREGTPLANGVYLYVVSASRWGKPPWRSRVRKLALVY